MVGSHLGFRMTTMIVNKYRREEGKEQVRVSVVLNAFYWLKQKITIIKKVQSGGLNQGWIDASYNSQNRYELSWDGYWRTRPWQMV